MCAKWLSWLLSKMFFLMYIVALLVLSLLGRCSPREQPAPERSFTPEDLLVSQEVIPSAWKALGQPFLPAGHDLVTEESTTLRFGIAGEEPAVRAVQEVFRYLSRGIAQRKFEVVYMPQVAYFDSVNEWTYRSPTAERSYFGCYDWEGRATPVCEWAGQYEEYIVVFRVHMTPGEVSLADIERVVRAIDARMAQYLDKPFEGSGD